MRSADSRHTKGFTLIELLVVIAIIGLLSAVVLASLNAARGKARDAKRKAELDQIHTALVLFYDTHGYLPITSSYGEANGGNWDYSSVGDFLPFLEPAFMPTVPVDPVNDGTGDALHSGTGFAYAYFCYSADDTLSLGTKLEDGTRYWRVYFEPGWNCQ